MRDERPKQEFQVLEESKRSTNKVVKKLNGVADKIIPPRKEITAESTTEKIAKLIYGKTILSDLDRS